MYSEKPVNKFVNKTNMEPEELSQERPNFDISKIGCGGHFKIIFNQYLFFLIPFFIIIVIRTQLNCINNEYEKLINPKVI